MTGKKIPGGDSHWRQDQEEEAEEQLYFPHFLAIVEAMGKKKNWSNLGQYSILKADLHVIARDKK